MMADAGSSRAALERVREYIDRHYAKPLTVARLAKLAGHSTFHFIRAFRTATGQKGGLGSGVFQVDDCRKTYEDLKKKGVQFAGAPEDRFYGIEAIMKDGLGNWFSMTQPKAWQG